jgi:hypothetical protein
MGILLHWFTNKVINSYRKLRSDSSCCKCYWCVQTALLTLHGTRRAHGSDWSCCKCYWCVQTALPTLHGTRRAHGSDWSCCKCCWCVQTALLTLHGTRRAHGSDWSCCKCCRCVQTALLTLHGTRRAHGSGWSCSSFSWNRPHLQWRSRRNTSSVGHAVTYRTVTRLLAHPTVVSVQGSCLTACNYNVHEH